MALPDRKRTLFVIFNTSRCYLSWSQRFFLIFPRVREQRSGECESRSGEKEKPLVTLDLNLAFTQTPAVKLFKFIITKGTNRNSVIKCLSAPGNCSQSVGRIQLKTTKAVRQRRFCDDKHYYGACFLTSRSVRRTRDCRIQRNKFL